MVFRPGLKAIGGRRYAGVYVILSVEHAPTDYFRDKRNTLALLKVLAGGKYEFPSLVFTKPRANRRASRPLKLNGGSANAAASELFKHFASPLKTYNLVEISLCPRSSTLICVSAQYQRYRSRV